MCGLEGRDAQRSHGQWKAMAHILYHVPLSPPKSSLSFSTSGLYHHIEREEKRRGKGKMGKKRKHILVFVVMLNKETKTRSPGTGNPPERYGHNSDQFLQRSRLLEGPESLATNSREVSHGHRTPKQKPQKVLRCRRNLRNLWRKKYTTDLGVKSTTLESS